jgi:undecaprenyl-diphosphatase
MGILQALLLGLIQGLTEFIPVSSSGHLVIFHHLLGVNETGLAFDVALHAGTLIALVAYFWKDIWQLLRALFKHNHKTRLAWLLIAATVPAAVIGYLLESAAESSFRSIKLVSLTMLTFGLVMLLAEHYYKNRKHHTALENVTLKESMAMGFAQALAIVPGVSRSGSTITAGLLTGLDRVSATRFSFLLGIPITFGAILKVFTEASFASQVKNEQMVFVVGVITALLSGLFAIRFMLKYLSKHGLYAFAYYRMALALLVLFILAIR